MKLLIVTQVIDRTDPVLGFFHRWAEEFANHCEQVTVICLKKDEHALPKNARVFSLGKEDGEVSRFSYSLRFVSLIWKLRNEYDTVFIHMNPEYVVLGGLIWRVFRKPVALWYMHKNVTLPLRLAAIFADVIFTASPRSFRIQSSKKRVVGHGLDLTSFPLQKTPSIDTPLVFLTVGRLSPIKRVDILIEAFALYKGNARLRIAGAAAGKEGSIYEETLRTLVKKLNLSNKVEFLGKVSPDKVSELFKTTHVFLHASDTGSLDKASLEPLAVGVPVITTNEELGAAECPAIFLTKPSARSIADAIERVVNERPWADIETREAARAYVEQEHDLRKLIPRILYELQRAASSFGKDSLLSKI